jgi:hypothetical protein
MDPADLERLLDRELRHLPRPRAPHTLLPRVLAATAGAGASEAATGWFTWPRAWQAASLAIVIVLAAGISWLVMAAPSRLTGVADAAGKTAAVMRMFWDVGLQPVAAYLFVLGVALTLACAAAWAALGVALGGASQQ